jgi:predicted  nucleic acid-binding Zn-ribbon protein
MAHRAQGSLMAMPARKLELEIPVEDRLGKIEAHVEHMRSDISDLKIDVRRLNDKIDAWDKRLSGRIDDVNKRLTSKIDGLKDSMEKEF